MSKLSCRSQADVGTLMKKYSPCGHLNLYTMLVTEVTSQGREFIIDDKISCIEIWIIYCGPKELFALLFTP